MIHLNQWGLRSGRRGARPVARSEELLGLQVRDHRGHERYYDRLQEMVRALRLDEVVFTGHLDDDELLACYSVADVFLCLSEHEGFCVPLLEAMAADLPVLAYASTAVPDTLGGAGVLFAPKDLEFASELLGELAYNETLRARVIAGQRRRLSDFGDDRIMRELDGVLALSGRRTVQENPS